MEHNTEETTVLIVGAGPTGLSLAAILGLAGIEVSIPEAETVLRIRILTSP